MRIYCAQPSQWISSSIHPVHSYYLRNSLYPQSCREYSYHIYRGYSNHVDPIELTGDLEEMSSDPDNTEAPELFQFTRTKPPIPTEKQCLRRLQNYIKWDKTNLGKALFKDVDLKPFSEQAAKMVEGLIEQYGCFYAELAVELSILTLYDLVVLIDDSSSMNIEDDAKRIETLQNTLGEIAKIYTLANPDGIKSVRFLNHRQGKGNVKLEDVEAVVKRCAFSGLTMMGTELRKKILVPFVLNPKQALKKPVLIMTITDGGIEGERNGLLEEVILDCVSQLKKKPEIGEDAVAFHFSRVGTEEEGRELLNWLDDHKKIGDHVDCLPETMPLEDIAKTEVWERKKWDVLPKLLLGAIVPSMDANDKDPDLEADSGVEKGEDGGVPDDD